MPVHSIRDGIYLFLKGLLLINTPLIGLPLPNVLHSHNFQPSWIFKFPFSPLVFPVRELLNTAQYPGCFSSI